MSARRKIVVGAGEASGDLLGAELIRALRSERPDLEIAGIGGAAMAAEGVTSPIDIAGLAIFGIIDGLKNYNTIVQLSDQSADFIEAADPDITILIDSWGWTQRVAERLRERGYTGQIVKFIGPQVWAARPGRAKKIASVYDHLFAINTMDKPFYDGLDISVTEVGNPAASRDHPVISQQEARRVLGFADDDVVLAVALGSRESEIKKLEPTIARTVNEIMASMPKLKLVSPVSDSIEKQATAALKAWDHPVTIVPGKERWTAFSAADAALAISGTVTTEIGLCGTPVVVGYKLEWVSGILSIWMFHADYITLMNLAVGAEIAPEFIQFGFNPNDMSKAVLKLLRDPEARRLQVEAQNKALDIMGRHGEKPAVRAAKRIIEILEFDAPMHPAAPDIPA